MLMQLDCNVLGMLYFTLCLAYTTRFILCIVCCIYLLCLGDVQVGQLDVFQEQTSVEMLWYSVLTVIGCDQMALWLGGWRCSGYDCSSQGHRMWGS